MSSAGLPWPHNDRTDGLLGFPGDKNGEAILGNQFRFRARRRNGKGDSKNEFRFRRLKAFLHTYLYGPKNGGRR